MGPKPNSLTLFADPFRPTEHVQNRWPNPSRMAITQAQRPTDQLTKPDRYFLSSTWPHARPRRHASCLQFAVSTAASTHQLHVHKAKLVKPFAWPLHASFFHALWRFSRCTKVASAQPSKWSSPNVTACFRKATNDPSLEHAKLDQQLFFVFPFFSENHGTNDPS